LILGLIPARGGSKSIPRKNVKEVGGKPLICHTIDVSIQSTLIDKTVVSTDDPEIASVSSNAGADVILRPTCISGDRSLDYQFTIHALLEMEDEHPDVIVHLRPTYPFREVAVVDDAITEFVCNVDAHSLRSVSLSTQTPYKMWRIEAGLLTPVITDSGILEAYNRPRQSLPDVYWQNGYVDITRWDTIMDHGSMTGSIIIPYVIDETYPLDIDYDHNFEQAERIFREGKISMAGRRWAS
jgi:CMP-N,N'-diacetyllegionaminic acid synthase